MKFELSLDSSVTANPKTVLQFKNSQFPHTRWNYKTFKNVRRLKHLAKKFNRSMLKDLAMGIRKEFTPVHSFELFATCEGELGMRPQSLRYQPYWIPVHARNA
mgnify:CR=1 FL=1